MALNTLLGLIACNIVWSAIPVMAKFILADFSPVHTACLRYIGAFSSYLIAVFIFRKKLKDSFCIPKSGRDFFWIFLQGFSAFTYSSMMAMTGLHASHAVDNALIVAVEPLITVIIAWLILGERLRKDQFLGFVLALVGFVYLSGLNQHRLGENFSSHTLGNILLMLSLFGEGFYSTTAKKVMGRYSILGIFGTALFLGTACLILLTSLKEGLPNFSHFTVKSFIGVLWLGPLSTTLTYLYWIRALQTATIPTMALTLFVQPIVGTIWGLLFLSERLTASQWAGGAVLIAAVAIPAGIEIVRAKRPMHPEELPFT